MTSDVVNRAGARGAASKSVGWMAAAMLVFLGFAVSLSLIEIGTRLLLNDGTNFDIEMWRYAKDMKRVSTLPGVGHEHVPNSAGHYMGVDIEINSLGFRDREFAPTPPPGVTRILMLGDSVTLGWGTPVDETTARSLERRLNANLSQPRFEVINAGVGNYNTAMEVADFLGRGYQLSPDIVVLNYFINDAEPTPARTQNALFEHSYAAVAAAGAVDTLLRAYGKRPDWKSYYAGLYASHAQGWHHTRDAIAELAAFCRSRGIGLLVVNYPELHEIASYPFADVTAQIAAAAAANALPFVDLLPALVQVDDPQSLWVTPTDAHPNGVAAELYAERIEQALRSDFPDMF